MTFCVACFNFLKLFSYLNLQNSILAQLNKTFRPCCRSNHFNLNFCWNMKTGSLILCRMLERHLNSLRAVFSFITRMSASQAISYTYFRFKLAEAFVEVRTEGISKLLRFHALSLGVRSSSLRRLSSFSSYAQQNTAASQQLPFSWCLWAFPQTHHSGRVSV